MGENSAISWCDHTQNFWVGCTKISPACDSCYAESWAKRGGHPELWTGARRRTKTWNDPIKWNRDAEKTGIRPRVFCSSLADFFDNEVDSQWRDEAWEVIKATPNLRWMLLTKRIGNAAKMLPPDWGRGYPHVGLMSTMENQEVYDRDWPKLRRIPATWRGISMEPLLSDIKLHDTLGLHWVITGAESGPKARPSHPDWFRHIQAQCASNLIPYHHKQNGEWIGDSQAVPGPAICKAPFGSLAMDGRFCHGVWPAHRLDECMYRIGKKAAGCLLDGVEYKAFPAALEAA